jgi:hypothetical protein
MKKRWLTDAEQREVFDFLKNKPDSVKTRELLEFAFSYIFAIIGTYSLHIYSSAESWIRKTGQGDKW